MLRTGTVSSFVYRSHLDQGVGFDEPNGSFRVDRGLLCLAVPLFEGKESLAHGEKLKAETISFPAMGKGALALRPARAGEEARG